MKCDVCEKHISEEPVEVEAGSTKPGRFQLKNILHLPDGEASEVTMDFCDLACFCKYAVKIAITNEDFLNIDYRGYEKFLVGDQTRMGGGLITP